MGNSVQIQTQEKHLKAFESIDECKQYLADNLSALVSVNELIRGDIINVVDYANKTCEFYELNISLIKL